MKTRLVAAATALGIALLQLPSAAATTPVSEPTRASYAEAVEPICKRNTEANAKTLKGVRAQVQRSELKQAGGRFAAAAKALNATLGQLRAIPGPPADAETLRTWFGYLGDEVGLLGKTATKLRHEDAKGALRLTTALTQTVNRANAEMLGFPFHYCRGKVSQFT